MMFSRTIKQLQRLGAIILAMSFGLMISTAHASTLNLSQLLAQQKKIVQKIKRQNPQLQEAALIAGVRAYDHLRQAGKDQQNFLTIVDFTKPSNTKRLWVIDMALGQVKYFTYVAQGRNTGLNIAKHFSNQPGTDESSIGVYLTGHPYYGVDGYSMRLKGLDKGFNDNVYRRHIVMHPAWYVSKSFAEKYGRIGRTLGCFGLNKKIAPHIISQIKNGTVMVAYYPNQKWLSHSSYEQPI